MLSIEPVGNIRSQWGEGPIWWQQALYFVDIEGHRVHRFDPADGSEKSWDVGQRVGTVVPRESGGLVIAGDHGLLFLDEETGHLTAIADPEADKPDNRFNDGKCSPDGRFFAGTISLDDEGRGGKHQFMIGSKDGRQKYRQQACEAEQHAVEDELVAGFQFVIERLPHIDAGKAFG